MVAMDHQENVKQIEKGEKMKILVVDDDVVCRDLLLQYLSEHGLTQGVANGQEGLAAFQEALDSGDPYDLICLDIMMPGVNGQEILKLIRKLERNRGIAPADQVKVFMITGLTDSGNISEAFQDGRCDAYLSKPVNLVHLGKHLVALQQDVSELEH